MPKLEYTVVVSSKGKGHATALLPATAEEIGRTLCGRKCDGWKVAIEKTLDDGCKRCRQRITGE